MIERAHFSFKQMLKKLINSCTKDTIKNVYEVLNLPKDLRPYELHLGHGAIIDMEGLYNVDEIHDEFQMYPDRSGEYKDVKFKCYDAHQVLELINAGFAEIIGINKDNTEYYIRMRRHY